MKRSKLRKILDKTLTIYTVIGIFFIIASLALFLIPSIPQLFYSLDKDSTTNEVTTIAIDVEQKEEEIVKNTDPLPPFDETLPKKNYIIIPAIGVRSPLSQSSNYTEVLKKGAWMVNNFPSPDDLKKPVIIAAHRFGYIYWSEVERKEISFYNLPKLKNGDIVEIIWGQRKYTYKIKTSSEGRNITNYGYDLILYTCKLYNSPIRIFKYANLIPTP